MQHNWFLWLFFTAISLGFGVLISGYFSRVSSQYATRLHTGAIPDVWLLMQCLLDSLKTESTYIIVGNGSKHRSAISLFCGIAIGVIIVGFWLIYGFSSHFAVIICFLLSLFIQAFIDSKSHILPDAINLPLMWLGIAYSLFSYSNLLENSVLGVFVGYGIIIIPGVIWQAITGSSGIGHGDAKLMAAIGAWIGPWVIPYILLLACLTNILFAIFQQRRLFPVGAYPFGPFIVTSTVIIMLLQANTIG